MVIRRDNLTLKAQEAIQAAAEVVSAHGNSEIMPCICCPRSPQTQRTSLARDGQDRY